MARPTIQLQGGRSRAGRSRGRWTRWLLALLGGLLLAAGVIFFGFWGRSSRVISPVPASSVSGPTAIALRPVVTPAASAGRASESAARLPSPGSLNVSNSPAPRLAAPPSSATRVTPASGESTNSPVPPIAVLQPTTPRPTGVNSPSNLAAFSRSSSNAVFRVDSNANAKTNADSARWFLPSTNRVALQIALENRGISCGSIDGLPGAQTESALRAFQIQQGLEPDGRPNVETLRRLQPGGRCLTSRRIAESDLARLRPLPTTWLGKSQLARLDFETLLELIAEETHAHPRLIRQLNPSANLDAVSVGTELIVPRIEAPPARHAATVRINLSQRWLRAYDEQGALLLHFPCSIGRIAEKRPVGSLQVLVTVKDPNYTFDPAVFPESAEARQIRTKLILHPGPNNPVGVAWIGLNRPGFGIHGTPGPEQVGRTESHGCFRLANWNAELLRRRVSPGTPVLIEP